LGINILAGYPLNHGKHLLNQWGYRMNHWGNPLNHEDCRLNYFDSYLNFGDSEDTAAKNVNSKTGRYIFIVTPGKYIINITGNGFKPLQQEIIIYDKSDFTGEVERNFTLLPDK